MKLEQARDQFGAGWRTGKRVLVWLREHAGQALGAALLLTAALAWGEHEARRRREAELSRQLQEAANDVAALRAEAGQAMANARARERALRHLETRRAQLEKDAERLRAQLSFLRQEERALVRPSSTPGHTDMLAGVVASRPDPARSGAEDSGFGVRDSGVGDAKPRDSKFETRTPTIEPADPNFDFPVPSFENSNPDLRIPNPGPRHCFEQLQVQGALLGNCEERAALGRAALDEAKHSADEWRRALAAQDALAARLDAQHQAELRAARGSRLGRFARAMKYVGVGVVIGLAIAL
jgi:hypothetical protein